MSASVVPVSGRLLALDVGDRRIGVAATDALRLIATPRAVIERRGLERDAAAVADMARDLGVVAIVVGMPLLPSGDVGEQAMKVRAFVVALAAACELPLVAWDESYTTLEASRLRAERGARRRARRGVMGLDAEAAAVILEEWLRANEPAQRRASVEAPRAPDAHG